MSDRIGGADARISWKPPASKPRVRAELPRRRSPRESGRRHPLAPGARGRGQVRAVRSTPLLPGGVGAGARPGEPARDAGRPGRDPGRAAGAGPLRAHARLALHVLPGRRGDHGRRPGLEAQQRACGAALRRRPPLQLRRLPGPGSRHRLRHQRLRRDASRPVRVGPEAARGEPGDRGARPRLRGPHATGGRAGRNGRVPRGDAQVRRHAGHGRLVRAARRREADGSLGGRHHRRRIGSASSATSRRPRTRTACAPCRS